MDAARKHLNDLEASCGEIGGGAGDDVAQAFAEGTSRGSGDCLQDGLSAAKPITCFPRCAAEEDSLRSTHPTSNMFYPARRAVPARAPR